MLRKILATGIGSMPQKEPPQALDLIFKYTPFVPFWPQLPKRDIREGMCLQFSEGFSFLKASKAGLIYERKNLEKNLQDFYGYIINEDIDYFKITSEFALGLYFFYERLKNMDLKEIQFIKLQITGPFTFAAGIKDEEGNLVLQDNILMEAVSKGLARKALWQIKFFKEFKKRFILFFDEPYLSCFGSAYTPINREEIVRILNQIFEELKELAFQKLSLDAKDILLGVHCCGNTDWSIFMEIPNLDIISFDAFNFADRLLLYTQPIKGFLKRKGLLCWGIIPTLEFNDRMNETFLLKKFNSILNEFFKKGLDRKLVLDNLILTPVCGLGNLEESKAEAILDLLLKISFHLSKADKNFGQT
jgi:methionine synthase II (cobalamin-independent)